MLRRTLVCAAIIALAAWAAFDRPGLAQGDKKSATGDKATGDKTTGDKGASAEMFALKASESDLAEINLANLALQKAKSGDVKSFAQKMVEDHGKSSKELITLANKKGLRLAPTMGAEHKAAFDQLLKLSGEAFDHAYMQGQVKDHEKAVALYRQQSQGGQDADLKAFAAKGLPIVEHHLKMAQDIAGKTQATPEKTKDKTGTTEKDKTGK